MPFVISLTDATNSEQLTSRSMFLLQMLIALHIAKKNRRLLWKQNFTNVSRTIRRPSLP